MRALRIAQNQQQLIRSFLWALGFCALGTIALLLVLLPLRIAFILAVASTILLSFLIRPWLAWVALAMILPISSGIAIGPVHLTDLLLVAIIGLWFIDGVRRRSLQWQPTWLLFPLAIYCGMLYLSLLQATDPIQAVTELLKWVQFAVVLLIMPTMVKRQHVQWVVIGLLVGGVLQALIGIYQFIFRIGPEWFIVMGRFMRASGTFSQPNPYAGYLGLTLPIALSLMLWALQRFMQPYVPLQSRDDERVVTRNIPFAREAWLRHRQHLWHRGGLLLGTSVATGLIGAALLASWSRGGWLGALGSTTIILLSRSRRVLLWGVIALLFLPIALLLGLLQPSMIPQPLVARFADVPAYFGMTDMLNQPLTDENFAIIERLAHWDAALRMWEQAPWFGIGPGNYATVYPEVRLPLWEEALGHAHNIYLNTLAESGIGGLLAYLFLWATFFLWLWRVHRSSERTDRDLQAQWQGPLIIGAVGMLCHLSIHNFFDNLFVQGMYLHIGLWLAIILTLVQPGSGQSGSRQSGSGQSGSRQSGSGQ